MTTILWPINTLRAQNVAFDIASRSLAAPASVSGVSQVVASDAGIWKATLGGIVVRSREAVIAFRALANLLEGRLNPVMVPTCRAYQPIPSGFTSTTAAALLDDVPHSDDAFFEDDTGYGGSTANIVLTNSVASRAVSANITIEYGGQLEPGMFFSLGDRLYRVRTAVYSTPTAAAITFRPPLREAATAGDVLEIDRPACRMRLLDDSQMDLELQLRRFSNPSVSFIEDL